MMLMTMTAIVHEAEALDPRYVEGLEKDGGDDDNDEDDDEAMAQYADESWTGGAVNREDVAMEVHGDAEDEITMEDVTCPTDGGGSNDDDGDDGDGGRNENQDCNGMCRNPAWGNSC